MRTFFTAAALLLFVHGVQAQYNTGSGNLNVVAGGGQPGNAAVAGDASIAGNADVHGILTLTGAQNTNWAFYALKQ